MTFSELSTIQIAPFEVKGRALVAKVSGRFDFGRRKAPKSLAVWQAAPTASANCGIELWEVTGKEVCARQHLDLANAAQPGPMWHLQLGGLASGGRARRELEWLDVPRWPTLPMDLILLLELAIYSFHPQGWNELRASNPWRDIVKRSERLMLQHFQGRLGMYWNQAEAGDSWLAYQCNLTSGWNPRPA